MALVPILPPLAAMGTIFDSRNAQKGTFWELFLHRRLPRDEKSQRPGCLHKATCTQSPPQNGPGRPETRFSLILDNFYMIFDPNLLHFSTHLDTPQPQPILVTNNTLQTINHQQPKTHKSVLAPTGPRTTNSSTISLKRRPSGMRASDEPPLLGPKNENRRALQMES